MIAAQLTDLDKPAAKALCLQFIMHEYAKALEIASTFKGCSRQGYLEKLDQMYPDLTEGMPALRLGTLRKLCFYCEALLETSQKGEDLLNVLDDLRLAAARERRGSTPSECLYEKLLTFFPLLTKYLEECKNCEVPLFALLELRATFNRHIGARAIESLLQTMFESPQELRDTLALGFAERGFEEVCKQHEKLFEGLTWEPLIRNR